MASVTEEAADDAPMGNTGASGNDNVLDEGRLRQALMKMMLPLLPATLWSCTSRSTPVFSLRGRQIPID